MFQLQLACGESDESIARRARVLRNRLARGELVKVEPWSDVAAELLRLLEEPRPSGAADGALPLDY